MELRQLRYFVRVAELGSMGRAAADLGLVTSALSQQIARLEGELSTRLLQRTAGGVVPTEAGLAFLRQARLALRHTDAAARAAQHARLSGTVSVGLAPTTGAVLGVPLMRAMRERYPEVRLHLVESLSGHLAAMLESRQIDLAVLFRADRGGRWGWRSRLDDVRSSGLVARPVWTGGVEGCVGAATAVVVEAVTDGVSGGCTNERSASSAIRSGTTR